METEPGEEILCPRMTGTAPSVHQRGVRVLRLPLAKEGVVFIGPGGPLNGTRWAGPGSLGLDGVVHTEKESFHGPGPRLTLDLMKES